MFENSSEVNKKPTECEKLRNLFVEALIHFEHCAIHNAVPVNMCNQCVVLYVEMLQTFHELRSTFNPKSVHELCSDEFMGHDTLDIVWRRYQSSRDLWNSASCNSMYIYFFLFNEFRMCTNANKKRQKEKKCEL